MDNSICLIRSTTQKPASHAHYDYLTYSSSIAPHKHTQKSSLTHFHFHINTDNNTALSGICYLEYQDLETQLYNRNLLTHLYTYYRHRFLCISEFYSTKHFFFFSSYVICIYAIFVLISA